MSLSEASRSVLGAALAVVCVACTLLGAAPAMADDPVFDRAFGAGPADLCDTNCRTGSSGGGAGAFTFPYGTAVSGGEVYIVDGNHRVSVFGTDGTFRRAFGKNVNAGTGDPDICTRASTCRTGAPGGGAGQLNSPYAVAVTGGEVYVADAGNNRIVVYSTAGAFARAFGKNVNPGGGDPNLCVNVCQSGSSGSAPGQLSFPLGVTISAGEVYIADASNNRVSVFSTLGEFARSFGDTGSGAGQLSFPFGIAVSGGEVFVADQNNQRVSVFATGGTFARAFGRSVSPSLSSPNVCTAVTTCRAGTAGGAAGQLNTPFGVAITSGEIYVADANHRVNVYAADGTFARAFGRSVNPGVGNANLCTATTTCLPGIAGPAAGQLNSPTGVAVSGGEVFVADTSNYRIGVFSTAGTFARAFGKSVWGASPFVCTTQTGCGAGAAGGAAAQLNLPFGVAPSGNEVFVADQSNHRIGVYAADGTFARAFGKNVNAGAGPADVCTTATTCRAGSSGSAPGQMSSPAAVAVGGGEVYVADQSNHRINVYGTDGTFARSFGGLGSGAGQLDTPAGVALSGGEVFVTDQTNRRISVFSAGGGFLRAFGKAVNAGAGSPDVCTTACKAGSQGPAAGELSAPTGIAVGGTEVFVADHFNNRIAVYATDGTFARAFGKGVNAGSGSPDVCTATTTCRAGSSGGAAGTLSFPFGIGVSDGALYVSERFNGRVSVLGTDGTFARAFGEDVNPGAGNPDVCTAATTCRAAAQGDAAGQFTEPLGVGVVGTKIYVADRLNHRVSVFRVPRTELSRNPVALAFGSRDVDDGPTASQTSTVTNTGTETVAFTGLALTGDAGHFARLTGVTGDCAPTTVLEPGETCALRMRFDPTTVGGKVATLTVTSNAPAITVALTGAGTQTELSRTPPTLAFGLRDIDDGAAGDLTSTVANTGTQTVSLSGLTLTGDVTDFTRLTGAQGDCSATTQLAPAQTCTVRFRFDPASIGAKTATLTVTSSASTMTIALTGTGIQTQLARSPAVVAFAARDVDDGAAAAQTATITNSGSEPVTLTAVLLTGDTTQFARLTGATGDCTTTTQLDAGESCTLRVRFDPTSTGAKTATLTVESNAAPVAVGLTGAGTQTALSRTPATLAFGARDVGAGPAAIQSATIANAGSETVTLTALTLTGDSTQFALLGGEATDCTPTTQLGSGETCTLRFRFDPTSTGAKAAAVAVDSNAATVTVALTGQGVHLELGRNPASLAFGARDVDTGPAPSRTSTLTNTGSDAVTITGFTFSGDAAHFARESATGGDCSITTRLDPGQSCALRVRFDPDSIGAKAATLTVASNAPAITVALTGSGIQTSLGSDPPELGFGNRDVDDGGTTQTATIANTGTEDVTVAALALSGDTGHFEHLTGAPGDCAAATPLDPGETCAARIRFDPSGTGPKHATLTVTSNAAALTVGLGGSGTSKEADSDGDGTPDSGDPDDDNDGFPDDRDAFPLDPTRHAADPPPAPVVPAARKPFAPWKLKKAGRVRVIVRRDALLVRSGYTAVCPKGGPACTGRLTLKLVRRSTRTRKAIPIFLTAKVKPITIRPGKRRPIAFVLSPRGRSLLLARGPFTAVLRGSLRSGEEKAVVRRAKLRLVAPPVR